MHLIEGIDGNIRLLMRLWISTFPKEGTASHLKNNLINLGLFYNFYSPSATTTIKHYPLNIF